MADKTLKKYRVVMKDGSHEPAFGMDVEIDRDDGIVKITDGEYNGDTFAVFANAKGAYVAEMDIVEMLSEEDADE